MIRQLLLRTLGRRVRAGFAGVGATTEALMPGPHVHGYRVDDPETWRAFTGQYPPTTIPAAVQRRGTPGGGERRHASHGAATAGHPDVPAYSPGAGASDPAGFLPP